MCTAACERKEVLVKVMHGNNIFIPVRLERVRIWKRSEPTIIVLIKENDSLLLILGKSFKIISSFRFQT